MKDYIKKLSIAASLLLFILQSCDSKRPTGYLAGSIMDSTYKPISNARIEVAGLKGLTDDEGKYFIKSLPHGRHKFQLYYATNILNFVVDIESDSIVMFDVMVDGGSNTPNYYNLYGKKNHLIPTNYDVLYATPSPDGRSFALEVFGGITLGSAIWQIGLSGNFMGIIQDEGAHSQIDGKPFVTDYEGHTVYEGNPIWSPDGKKILYQTFVYYNGRRRDYHLWQLDLEKGNQVLIDRGFTPNISRNGKRIVYSKVISESNGRLNWDIWEYSLEPKKRVKRLTTSRAKEQYPSWAYIHGKEYILYSAKQSGYYDIWKMEKDGTNPTPITFIGAEQKTDALGAMASPDGKKIVFWSVETGPGGIEMNEKIWIMNSDGSNLKMLVEGGANPMWGRDGKFIYFVANKTWRWQIWRSDARSEELN